MWLWLSLVLMAACLCTIVYVILSPMADEHLSKQVPSEVFSSMRWVWPWVAVLSNVITPFLTWKYQLHLRHQIMFAGFSGYIEKEHIAGLQALTGIVFFGLGIYLGFFLWDDMLFISGYASCMCVVGVYLPISFLRKKAQQRKKQILKTFPFLLDMLTLSVEAGLNLQGALQQSVYALPKGHLREELQHALNDMRTGVNRMDALKTMATRIGLNEVRQWVSAIGQAENLGMGLGPMLRAQSNQRRNERFLRAEKLALEAPVKMLFPLVVFIFPCTFIVLAFPIAMKLIHQGFL